MVVQCCQTHLYNALAKWEGVGSGMRCPWGCRAEVAWKPHLLAAQPHLLSDPADTGRKVQGSFLHWRKQKLWQLAPSTSCILFLCLSAYFCFLMSALGVTAGAHRLWSHRSYKAKLPLRIFLAAANSMAFQVGFWLPVQILGHQETFSCVQSSRQLRGSKRKKMSWQKDIFW